MEAPPTAQDVRSWWGLLAWVFVGVGGDARTNHHRRREPDNRHPQSHSAAKSAAPGTRHQDTHRGTRPRTNNHTATPHMPNHHPPFFSRTNPRHTHHNTPTTMGPHMMIPIITCISERFALRT